LKDGKIDNYFIKPEDYGIHRAKREEILGGSVSENAEIAIKILKNEEKGAKREIVLINAAAAIFVGGKARDITEGVKLAAESLNSGAAGRKLEELIQFTSKPNS
jgi:anthranilate phosphoribosyltransferase